jgi:hypothetical protein
MSLRLSAEFQCLSGKSAGKHVSMTQCDIVILRMQFHIQNLVSELGVLINKC